MIEGLRPQWIDSASGIADLADRCCAAGQFALDTEADSLHSYFHKVCLIQVTVGDLNAVVDPLALEPVDLGPLFDVCRRPDVKVLMHGADYDVRVLDRDYGAQIRGLVDTQIMAQILGEPRTGLAALLEGDFGVVLDKKHQRADWGRRPLSESMLAYAAADTVFLARLAAKLQRRLEEMGRWTWAEEEFAKLEGVRHVFVEPDPYAFERVKGVGNLRGRSRDIAFSLFQWRDSEAQRRNVPPFKVFGNRSLIVLATDPPTDGKALAKVEGMGPRFVARSGRKVIAVLERPQSSPDRRRSLRRPIVEPEVKRRMKKLLEKRDLIGNELGIPGGFLCPRAVVVEVAAAKGP